MRRSRLVAYATGLVASPLLIAVYWVLYPAYGDVHASDIATHIGAAAGRAGTADVFALAAVFLAVPGVLAYLQALRAAGARLAYAGCALALVGWMAILPLLTMDVVARKAAGDPHLFKAVYASGTITAMSALATLHVIGGVVIGVALLRTRLLPRPLGVAATLAPVLHLGANLAGVLWLDVACWVILAATGVVVLPTVARLVAADKAVLGGEEASRGARAHPDLRVDVLDVP